MGADCDELQRPDKGVVPILVHTLCGNPDRMRTRSHGKLSMMERLSDSLKDDDTASWLTRRVRFAKQQARDNGSAAAVFVVDSDGFYTKTRDNLSEGRDSVLPEFPMAVGVAHPCIEAWLLSDSAAIRRGCDLPETPPVPAEPEKRPAPCQDRKRNPKTVLAAAAGSKKGDLSAKEKDRIVKAMNDMNLLRKRCPEGFAPFAGEVQQYIAPLFPQPPALPGDA